MEGILPPPPPLPIILRQVIRGAEFVDHYFIRSVRELNVKLVSALES